MGILSWWKGGADKTDKPSPPNPNPKKDLSASATVAEEAAGMNGAVEVSRPLRPASDKVTVFEFGSVAASADKVTLVGYCPVSDDLEPCRWEIFPAAASDAPQFRVAF